MLRVPRALSSLEFSRVAVVRLLLVSVSLAMTMKTTAGVTASMPVLGLGSRRLDSDASRSRLDVTRDDPGRFPEHPYVGSEPKRRQKKTVSRRIDLKIELFNFQLNLLNDCSLKPNNNIICNRANSPFF